MKRELVLKIVLAVVGILFIATAYPMIVFVRREPALSMMFSLYVTLGVFLLLAIRNPSAHRSLIAFTAWSSFVHAVWMGMQALLQYGCARRADRRGGSHHHRHRAARTRPRNLFYIVEADNDSRVIGDEPYVSIHMMALLTTPYTSQNRNGSPNGGPFVVPLIPDPCFYCFPNR